MQVIAVTDPELRERRRGRAGIRRVVVAYQ
jgi:hypothetical protein